MRQPSHPLRFVNYLLLAAVLLSITPSRPLSAAADTSEMTAPAASSDQEDTSVGASADGISAHIGAEELPLQATQDPNQIRERIPLLFIPNRGQTASSVRFQALGSSEALFFTRNSVVLSLPYMNLDPSEPPSSDGGQSSRPNQRANDQRQNRRVRVDLQFVGTQGAREVQGLDEQAGIVNFLTSEKEADRRTNLPAYQGLLYDELYPGIDLHFEGQGQYLKSTYIVAPGADPSVITWTYGQNAETQLDEKGNLQITIRPRGRGKVDIPVTLTEQAPVAWQDIDGQKVPVDVYYEVASSGQVTFVVGEYDPATSLIVDPNLLYSTFLGDGSSDSASKIAKSSVDNAVYIVGTTDISSFPATAGAYDTSHNGNSDIFITKLAENGDLIYSTFLGGIGDEYSSDIAVDGANAIYITGYTGSSAFPITTGAYDPSHNGSNDVFITKLTASGSLAYSTFLGGSNQDYAYGIALDSTNAAYVTGVTYSSTYPTTSGAYDTTYNSGEDGFVAKLTASGSLAYSTFLGGSVQDYAYNIAVDSTNAVYVTGYTGSSTFPTTAGAYDTTFNGAYDAFVTKLTTSGGLAYSTFLGGGNSEVVYGIAVDSTNAAYVTGYTTSSTFPTTAGAYDTSHNGANDVFIAKLTASGSLAYSTFLGGSSQDYAYDIAVDSTNTAYVTGFTQSTNFPTSAGAYDTSHNGGTYDVFITKLTASGSLAYSTFLGGSSNDLGQGIIIGNNNAIYVAGNTQSSNFPTTTGAYDVSINGSSDIFVTKLTTSGSLDYSTFLGGAGESASDVGRQVGVDSSGNIYITGTTASAFPTTTDAYDTTYNGGNDVFITKLTASGDLVYSTFLGGGSSDVAYGIAVDSTDAVYVTGITYSSTFPTTAGAYDTTYNGGTYDGFVTKLTTSGGLAYSTFLGGTDIEIAYGIAIDSTNAAYVIGQTGSSTFPTTAGAYDTSHNGGNDVFVTKLTASGSLAYSTFLGGASAEDAYGIAIDDANAVYVTGGTQSSTFPTTVGAYDASHNGSTDIFVTKLTTSGSLAYSTFLGGSSLEVAYGIAVDSTNAVYVTGFTLSSTFPTSAGAYDASFNGNRDIFVTKLTTSGSLVYSTFLGGTDFEIAYGIAVDSTNAAYVTGQTGSSTFPTTIGAYDTSHNGGTYDAFVTKLTASGSLAYSTFLGGSSDDFGYGIAFYGSQWVITGKTSSYDFPTTGQTADSIYNIQDAFVTIIGEDIEPPSTPNNLRATNRTATTIGLSWEPSTDNFDVTSYDIYRGTSLVGSSATTVYTATGLTSSTVYTFTVRARDAVGNESLPSPELSLRTADITPPTAPSNLRVKDASSTRVLLEWDAASDNIAVTGYDVYASTTKIGSATPTEFVVENVQVLATYSFSVVARDLDGNSSPPSASLQVTVPDTDAPLAPTNLAVSGATDTSATLTWDAATDNVAITSYRVYQGSTAVVTTTATTITIPGLTADMAYGYAVRASDAAGNESALSAGVVAFTTDTVAPTTPANLRLVRRTDRVLEVAWDAESDNVAVVGYEVLVGGVGLPTVTLTQTTITNLLPNSSYAINVRALDPSGNQSAASLALLATTLPDDGLPDDPRDVAPPLDRTIITDIADATEFLYTGPNPIQTGVVSGTIDSQRVSVLRGQVQTSAGVPLPGVEITILGHPEFGSTLSRADGFFDLAVNGGGVLTVIYSHPSYLPAQRQIDAPWQTYGWLPLVQLLQAGLPTAISLTGIEPIQVVRGQLESDADGQRQATVLFTEGVTATMVLSDSSEVALSQLDVSVTEYTVGANGPSLMPAALPPNSGYTYAAEFRIEQAAQAGAQSVRFSQPVFAYVENFIDFPVGEIVPAGYYDFAQAAWVPSDNGRVIAIVAIVNGLAELDSDGDGIADNDSLRIAGVTDEEREQLATLYAVGQELWRVPLNHFSPWDFNWPYGPPAGATAPTGAPLFEAELDARCVWDARAIPCENQTLHTAEPVLDTPFALHYSSDRVPGRTAAYQLAVPVTGSSLPVTPKVAQVTVSVAGRQIIQRFSTPTTNLTTTITWDGRDAYGRLVQGEQPVHVRVEYLYDQVRYQRASDFDRAFAQFGEAGGQIGNTRTGVEYTIARTWAGRLGVLDVQAQGLGGLTLTPHHVYDPNLQVVHYGDGTRRQLGGATIATLAGTGTAGDSGDGGAGPAAELSTPDDVAVSARGEVYIADTDNHRIRRVVGNGQHSTITTVAGDGTVASDFSDGTGLPLANPSRVVVAPNGNLYIAEDSGGYGGERFYLTRIALNGSSPYIDRVTTFTDISGLAVAADGTVYVADAGTEQIWQVRRDGSKRPLILTGVTSLLGPAGLAIDPAGNLYIAESAADRVLRVSPSGTVTTLVGTGSSATLSWPQRLAVRDDGTLYISSDQFVWQLSAEGVLAPYAGAEASGMHNEGGPASETSLDSPTGLAIHPDGSLIVADPAIHRVWRVSRVVPTTAQNEVLIPSEDGSIVDVFDQQGRHLRIVDATTGVSLLTFTYAGAEALGGITDNTGRVTTIARIGSQTKVTAPSGAATLVSIGGIGRYATAITNDAPASTRLTMSGTGLLTEHVSPHDGTTSFTYTPQGGRLATIVNPAQGTTSLVRTLSSAAGFTVRVTNPLNHWVDYRIETLPDGATRRSRLSATGASESATITLAARTIAEVDGTTTQITDGPDPRWGMLAPVQVGLYGLVGSPGAPFASLTMTRTVTGLSLTNPFAFTQLATVLETNGHLAANHQVTQIVYTPANRQFTITDPTGQVTVQREDPQGRVIWDQTGALPAVSYTYKPMSSGSASSGLLASITETPQAGANPTGEPARTTSYTYDSHGYLDVITYPQGTENYNYLFPAIRGYTMTMQPSGLRVQVINRPSGEPEQTIDAQGVITQYMYDSSGRLAWQRVGQGTETVASIYIYNTHNLLTSVTVGGVDQQITTILPQAIGIDTYQPGTVGVTGGASAVYTYRPDGQVASTTRALDTNVQGTTTRTYYPQGWLHTETTPGGRQTSYTYRTDGALQTVTDPRGSVTAYTYDAAGRTKTVTANTTAIGGYAAVNAQTEYVYEVGTNRIDEIIDPRNQSWNVSYDGYGRTWQESDPLGNTTTTRYDLMDHPNQRILGSNNAAEQLVVEYNYDAQGRLLSERRDPNGLNLITTYSYQTPGGIPQWNVGSVADPRTASTRYSYNSRGLLARTTDAHDEIWEFAYNNLDQLVRQSGPDGWIQSTDFNLAARTTTEVDSGRQQTTSYRLDGRVAAVTDFAGQVTSYSYAGNDGLDGLVTSIDAAGALADASFSYDAAGNLQNMTDSAGSTSYQYDGLNRLRQHTRTNMGAPARTVGYIYDPAGNTTNVSYFGLGSVIYTYDNAGRMQSLTPWSAPATTYDYRSSGLLDMQTRGNGVSTNYNYDGAGRLEEIVHAHGNTMLETIAYPERDANGNVKERVDGDGTTSYSYDALNRLLSVSYPTLGTSAPAYTETFGYDARGNRTHYNGDFVADYASDNRIPGRQDGNGNLLSAETGDDNSTTEITYHYDGANRLRQIDQEQFTLGGSDLTVSTYRYDGQGRQVARESDLAQLAFVYDERGSLPRVLGELASEPLPGIAATRLYAYGPDGIAAQRTIDSDAGDTIQYPLLDELGTARGVTDAAGTPLLWQSYDAFGVERAQQAVAQAPFGMGFTGELQDPLTGNVFLRARSYAPTTGRFVQRNNAAGNVSQPQSLNRYTYTGNNPVNLLDPNTQCHGGITCHILQDQDPQPWNWNTSLDSFQAGLDMVGLLPAGVTELADGANALISLARGNYTDAALSAGAMIPFAGWGATASKNALKLSDEAAGVSAHASDVDLLDPPVELPSATHSSDAITACRNSFSADTPVLTAEGKKPISEVEVGDSVLAYHEGLRATAVYTVTATFSHLDPVVVELTLDGEAIETTPEHPFFVLLRGWVDAGDLQPGMAVRRADGTYGVVKQVEVVQRTQWMYNLSVADAHTFFVGDDQWLVHNTGCIFTMPEDPLTRPSASAASALHLYDVIGHGSPYGFTLYDEVVTAAELADEILRQVDYVPGMPIRLVSCNTGACPIGGGLAFAQRLADELGVPVYSPNALVRPEGGRFVLSEPYHLGDTPRWILFQPKIIKHPLRLPANVPSLPGMALN